MVFQDLSSDSLNSSRIQNLRIAAVSDRILAFFFDVVLLGPIYSILMSSLMQKLEIRYYTSPSSVEFLILLGLVMMGFSILTIIGQTLFLTWLGATPGKYFFKLRVVSIKGNPRLSLDQALLRSFVWCLEVFAFCLPFFEVMSHGRRRPIHDRAAETMVVTLKENGDPGPVSIEGNFVKHILLTVICIFGFWGLLFFGKLYRMTMRGDFKKTELIAEQYLCDQISRSSEGAYDRLDIILAKYIGGETDQDCLLNEADFALWTNNEDLKPLAYLAKGFHYQYDKNLSKKYLQKACGKDPEVCAIAKYMMREGALPTQGKLLTFHALDLQLVFSRMDLKGVNQRIANFPLKHEFQSYLQNYQTMSYWVSNQKERSMGAYSNSLAFLNGTSRLHISSWMCLEQTDESCLNKTFEACDDLRQALREEPNFDVHPDILLALARESQCKKTDTFPRQAFRHSFARYPWLKTALESLDANSDFTAQERLENFKKLSNTTDVPIATRLRFLNWWAQKVENQTELLNAVGQLKKFPYQDWQWSKAMSQVAQRSKMLRNPAIADSEKPSFRSPASAVESLEKDSSR